MDDWSSTNDGMGRIKSNDKDPNDLDVNFTGPEWNQQSYEIVALADNLGRQLSELTVDADPDYASVNELMDKMVRRADRAGIHDHFMGSTGTGFLTIWFTAIAGGGAMAYGTVAGGTGVIVQTAAMGVETGMEHVDQLFHSRHTYYRTRFQISALPGNNGDIIQMGLRRVANCYVTINSTRAGGVWPEWQGTVNDGGAIASDTLTGAGVAAGEWHVAEILAYTTGAWFFMDRGGQGGYTEYSAQVTTQAPENGQTDPIISVTSAAGGEVLRTDAVSTQDTRTL